jgi:hypothetical protein
MLLGWIDLGTLKNRRPIVEVDQLPVADPNIGLVPGDDLEDVTIDPIAG